MGYIHVKLFEFEPVVQEEMLFKEIWYGRTMHARRWMQRITLAFGSGELNMCHQVVLSTSCPAPR